MRIICSERSHMTTLPTHEHTPSIVPTGKTPLSAIRKPGRPVEGRSLTGRDIMRIIRKHMWLISILLTVFTLASIGGTMLWLRYAPTYTSTVLLSVHMPQRFGETSARNVAADLDILKESYVRLATVDAVLHKAINRDGIEEEDVDIKSARDRIRAPNDGLSRDRIRKTSFFMKGGLAETTSLLKDELSVAALRDTNLIRISISGPRRRELPEVVNAVGDALVSFTKQRSRQRRAEQMQSLNDRLDEIAGQIAAKQKDIKDTRGQSEVSHMRERRSIIQMTLQSLTSELTQLRLVKAQAETAFDSLKEQQKSGKLAKSLEVMQALEQDATYRSLQTTVKNIQIELDSLLDRLGEGHRRVKATRARLKIIEKKRVDMEKELVEKQIDAMMQRQQSQVTAVSERLLAVGNQYNEQSQAMRDLGANLAKIGKLEDEIAKLLNSAAQVEEARLKFRIARDEVPLSVEAAGEIPLLPSMPKYTIMVPLGVFLGLVAGFGLAFLLELMDASIKGPADISSRIDLPLLGMIPHADDMDEDIEDMRTLMLTNAGSLAGEAYRQIRTCLLFSGPASQRRSLMVTSPSPGDGRTAVTMNLAASIAQGGRKVLVVDANFRQPSLSNLFPKASSNGLSSALVGQGRWEENVFEADRNLSIMTAGPLPPNPAELFGSEQMRTIIGEMTARYDQVIFDAAPALVVTDPSVLGTQVDGVIIVIRAGTSTHGILQRTRDIFLHVGAHVIGAVLNCVRVTAGGYLKKSYSTFYEYRGQQLPPPTGGRAPKPPIALEPDPQLAADIKPAGGSEPPDDADLS